MQLEVNKRTDYACEALLALARHTEELTAGATLADEIGVSPRYLPNVMQPLKAVGWVASTSGPSGGYRLAVPLGDISLLALIEAVEGPMDETRCVQVPEIHPSGDPCALHEPWVRASEVFLAELESASLEDLARGG